MVMMLAKERKRQGLYVMRLLKECSYLHSLRPATTLSNFYTRWCQISSQTLPTGPIKVKELDLWILWCWILDTHIGWASIAVHWKPAKQISIYGLFLLLITVNIVINHHCHQQTLITCESEASQPWLVNFTAELHCKHTVSHCSTRRSNGKKPSAKIQNSNLYYCAWQRAVYSSTRKECLTLSSIHSSAWQHWTLVSKGTRWSRWRKGQDMVEEGGGGGGKGTAHYVMMARMISMSGLSEEPPWHVGNHFPAPGLSCQHSTPILACCLKILPQFSTIHCWLPPHEVSWEQAHCLPRAGAVSDCILEFQDN